MDIDESRRGVLAWGLACVLAGPALAAAADESGVTVEGRLWRQRLRLFGAELQLNGTGIRAVAWFKGYVAGLYLAEPARTPAQVLAASGPKRLQLHLLHDVPVAELVKALNKGMKRNATAERLEQIGERLDGFSTQMLAVGKMRQGDIIDIDFDPARGTLAAVNGRLQGLPIAGVDFYETLLASFVGERPYDRKLKAGLLGLPVVP